MNDRFLNLLDLVPTFLDQFVLKEGTEIDDVSKDGLEFPIPVLNGLLDYGLAALVLGLEVVGVVESLGFLFPIQEQELDVLSLAADLANNADDLVCGVTKF